MGKTTILVAIMLLCPSLDTLSQSQIPQLAMIISKVMDPHQHMQHLLTQVKMDLPQHMELKVGPHKCLHLNKLLQFSLLVPNKGTLVNR